ncbi:MAG: tyrosine-type recombinase/integrase [bacterium]|nr:tyrosine-type recombinase/integrase [bacterium]
MDSNPCWRVTAPAPGRQRDRVLSEQEMRIVWEACSEMDIQYRSLFRLQILTAQRMGELRTMRWQDLDLEAGWWTIPGDMVKNSLSHRVPLTPQVKEILDVILAFKDNSSWVFPSPRRPGKTLSRFAMQSAVVRLRNQTDLDFVIHDLRRTAASHMTGMGSTPGSR